MKRKKPTDKPVVPPPECPVCGQTSEAEGQLCPSCMVMHQELVEIILKRSAMIRYARMYFYDAVCLYRLWLIENRRQKVHRRAKVIDEWFGKNRHNKAEEERFWELHWMFAEYLLSPLISQAEKKVEEMFEILEKR